ncbi:GDP-Man:Man(3)GlcNAc(2)-PP-Dol alpha-1,2-mannosyltransferase [Phlebotomus argentipes]|uniref:GDP-Man:Man(3)GlcNAc(2)-PP-Dol alpha-1,2-mannosyltransferase n=1 Tax=Phlebotomus argentipes TaxID=94469 RepID=UPI00289315F5|nr:GDP-Man:Man(3)GlcNAc(2)-PP-Dol alpha-1,2-mannosyltransferase [Phlebotomus argentipes]
MPCACSLLCTMTAGLFFTAVAGIFILLLLRVLFSGKRTRRVKEHPDATYIGLFHPYCNAGGGGERVLWCAVRCLLKKYPSAKIIIYTGDVGVTPRDILKKAKNTFNVSIQEKDVQFVYLHRRKWVEAVKYPYFTLLGQSLGSVWLGLEAAWKFPPDVFIDTMGYAFTFPIFRFLVGARVSGYVHYPTISSDMLRRVQARTLSHNNKNYVARNPFLTWIKLFYYRMFAKLYGLVGRCADIVMVNSSWTEGHINSLWQIPLTTHRVYPPCEVSDLKKLQFLGNDAERIVIMSVGQFRPEKDHPLQLQAMYELRSLLVNDEPLWNRLRLVIVGSCRHEEDVERMKNMKDLSKHLSLENSVEFRVNVTYQELLQCYQTARMGLHTMWNEHFGISVVECMAAGLIMVANRSGGPLMDIVETSPASQTGFLAVDAVEYAQCIATILYNEPEDNDTIRTAARASVDRFSESEFESAFLRVIAPLIELETPSKHE